MVDQTVKQVVPKEWDTPNEKKDGVYNANHLSTQLVATRAMAPSPSRNKLSSHMQQTRSIIVFMLTKKKKGTTLVCARCI